MQVALLLCGALKRKHACWLSRGVCNIPVTRLMGDRLLMKPPAPPPPPPSPGMPIPAPAAGICDTSKGVQPECNHRLNATARDGAYILSLSTLTDVSTYLRHGCRLWLVAGGYAVVLPLLRLCRHKGLLWHVKVLLLHLPRKAADVWHLWLLSCLLRECLRVWLLLIALVEAVGSRPRVSLGAGLRYRGTIRRWGAVVPLPITLL